MRLKKRCLLVVAIVLMLGMSLSVNAAGIMPRYNNIYTASTMISFNGTTASCKVMIGGSDNVTLINGTMELKDNTTGTLVDRWILSSGRNMNELKTATVTKGHSFTLTFSGFVYVGTTSEYVSTSSNGTCN